MQAVNHYTFGDTDNAAERLRLLAAAFAPSSADFVARASERRPKSLVDLGCGPGFTTLLLDSLLAPEVASGIDTSARFVELARRLAPSRMAFFEHDVTRAPLPCGPVELLYSRFLLTHLADPAGALSTFYDSTAPAGRLLLEETAFMRSAEPTLQRYYEIVHAMQANYGQAMYVGNTLDALVTRTPWTRVESRLTEFDIPVSAMAAIHHLNIRTWQSDPFIAQNYAATEIQSLEGALHALSEHGTPGFVHYGMQQIVLQR